MANPHYEPEKLGLTKIDELDIGGSYEFDMIISWRHEDGRVFWQTDSGCSCPTPFEEYDSLASLNELTDDPRRIEEFKAESRRFEKVEYGMPVTAEEVHRFVEATLAALSGGAT